MLIQGGSLLYPSDPTTITSTTSSHTPVIISNPATNSSILQEESFAPILTVQTFLSTSEALTLANSHSTGLSSSIYTSNLGEALKFARGLEAGAVHINGQTIHDEHKLPFGGVKDSGWGRFNGKGAVEGFTWTKSVTVGKGGMLPLAAI
jgi:acyl-CoA reductase-like NAD-dependent aldehyde dehydrogenase